jgi:hypothetical protein
MAEVLDYVAGTPFTIRTQSSLTSNRRVRWHNTFEARATAPGDNFVLEGMGSSIVGFLAAITYAYVTVDSITISTWVEDSHPYNPLGFLTTFYNQPGLLPLGVKTPVSLRQTLFIKRQTSSGLPGKLFVRGALSNEDLAYGDGEWVLADIAGMGADVHAAMLSNLGPYINGIAGDNLSLCVIGSAGETRWVGDLPVAGTSDIKLNHKYFDRAP